jgi:putative FmdB family regulatory protein
MIYEYECPACKHFFEKVKHHSLYKEPENCEKCGTVADKLVSLPNINKPEEPEFNHGLGCWTKSKEHRNEIAKSRGLVEVGNDAPSNIHKDADWNKKKNLRWDD